MGAKRAVAGRTRPYDELYLDWQRLHNPNFVEPVKRETKKEKRDKEREEKRKLQEAKKANEAATGVSSSKKKKKKSKSAADAAANAGANQVEGDEIDVDIDSEVELDAMVKGVKTAKQAGRIAVPLAVEEDYSVGSWFVARRERLRCCRDQLYSAFLGNRGGLGGMVR
jgi:SAGA-associated factor 73